MKIVRFLLGICLIPFCVAATDTLVRLVRSIQPLSVKAMPPAGWALLAGLVLWFFLYLTLSKPVMSYVFAHELTHALWGWLMGSKIFGMRLSKAGGSVTLSKSNVLISLAPYFFPLYTIIVIAAYCALSIFFEMEPYYLYWLGLVGFTWGFHVAFTIASLSGHQTDISQYGHVFSYAIIYLFNVLGIGLWVVAVSSATLEGMVKYMGNSAGTIWVWCFGVARTILAKIVQ